mmetsp:Transcript_65942/g.143955  ORF Transcript_65942/g.143955 Transcript_65942/m.143955 type:complete len:111 (+) Transcript_65942:95-427(+)|eukprot:CAMPEP_0175859824 /NCGR_PEP_ID=MMETSP0107_2-20121207/30475_1 /TAXON_ID=195067 ORGANISM="Goniomonas pacifica, Strain CCMP1869" /NCGR_SAMPLE_ID=MMETSP0107_2 /ASSEMBLY_ACC=CAM_ASM_000203 /LENGTH=110 /DNA_ID=CAMNT_0017176497 /DNA_START=128 /DNA_END=460 /DNA_ORIENTATION=+
MRQGTANSSSAPVDDPVSWLQLLLGLLVTRSPPFASDLFVSLLLYFLVSLLLGCGVATRTLIARKLIAPTLIAPAFIAISPALLQVFGQRPNPRPRKCSGVAEAELEVSL